MNPGRGLSEAEVRALADEARRRAKARQPL